MSDPLFVKARRFTNVETTTLRVWQQALVAGLNAEADAVNDAGLYLEHLLSLLPADGTTWTAEQQGEIDYASKVFGAAQDAVTIALTKQETDRAARSPEQGSGGGDAGTGGGYGGP